MTRTGGAGRVRLGLSALIAGLTVAALVPQVEDRDGRRGSPAIEEPVRPVRTVRGGAADPAGPPAPDATAAPVARRARVAPRAAESAADTEPEIRRPAELGPAAPDVVVAPEIAGLLDDAAPRPPAPADSAASAAVPLEPALRPQDGARAQGDGMDGWQPGDLYWFGPRGLQRVLVLTEEPR
jgi:hypothetical protein